MVCGQEMAVSREVLEIVIHCTATTAGVDFHASDVEAWHRKQGWNGMGYHFLICLDGTVEKGRLLSEVGAHCYGHNAHSVGVCYVGGLWENLSVGDTRTEAQRESLRRLLMCLQRRFPSAKVHGHNEFSNKDCPGWKVHEKGW